MFEKLIQHLHRMFKKKHLMILFVLELNKFLGSNPSRQWTQLAPPPFKVTNARHQSSLIAKWLSVYLAWHKTTTLLLNSPLLEELMESLDCCVLPMTNKRQGNQLVATALSHSPQSGRRRRDLLESASGLIIKRECFPKASTYMHSYY